MSHLIAGDRRKRISEFPMHHLHSSLAGVGSMLSRPSCQTRALSISLITALATPMLAVEANASPSAPQNWVVKNCNDSGTDSLRDIVENQNPPKAKSGDSVDLSQLPTLCGILDSTITLSSELVVAQDDLTFNGPSKGSVLISAAGISRAFHHTGMGTLAIFGLAVSNGYYHGANDVYGGCIESDNGDVSLNHVTVSHCTVMSDSGYSNGGGVSAELGNVTLIASKITGNHAKVGPSDSHSGYGGGVYSHNWTIAKYSSVSGNTAGGSGWGGGVDALGGGTFIASTIDNNISGYGAGVFIGADATILDSTISSNEANVSGGGIQVYYADPVIANTTIAGNHAGVKGAGVWLKGSPGMAKLTLQSSIVASNTATAASTPDDVYVVPGYGALAGADNLVVASNIADPVVITVISDPKLGQLQYNGGATKTQVLMAGSPALGKGNVAALPPTITTDQRGTGYPRTAGASMSVDLGAVQFDPIFADGFNWQF
jgi:hypothetical protein